MHMQKNHDDDGSKAHKPAQGMIFSFIVLMHVVCEEEEEEEEEEKGLDLELD